MGLFALGILLTAMSKALNLSYVQIGWVSTINFISYLSDALWVRRLMPRFGERRLITTTLMTVVATMVGISLAAKEAEAIVLQWSISPSSSLVCRPGACP